MQSSHAAMPGGAPAQEAPLLEETCLRPGCGAQAPFATRVHCGRCGTCIERREAFDLANVVDPTTYAEDAPSLETLRAMDWRL